MRFFHNANFPFIANRRRVAWVSVVVLAVGAVSLVVHGGFRYSIDFAGGSLVEIRMDNPVPVADLRKVMADAGFEGAEVTKFGAESEYLIKIKSVEDATAVADRINKVVATQFSDQMVEIRRIESVGPKIGGELRTAALWAMLYSLLGIVIYVSWRFQFRFAIAAIVATVHDVLITLGFFSVVNMEISLAVIAALLTVIGYSLNDTIVVFDRIREALETRRRDDYADLVNKAINETLSRTVITSLTTLFVVVCLVLLGGEVIKDFAVTLLVGISVGTYSSIFIASPVLVEWQLRKPRKTR